MANKAKSQRKAKGGKSIFNAEQLKRIGEITEEKSTTRAGAIKILDREERTAKKVAAKAEKDAARDAKKKAKADAKAAKKSAPKKARKSRETKPKAAKGEGRKPALAEFPNRPDEIFATFKGKEIVAKVNEDGSITVDGNRYTSPSVAGAIATGQPTCNGWKLWKFMREGQPVSIDELRKAS